MEFLHYCPKDGWFGDPMPLWHDGVYHVYFCKKFYDDILGWGHISTKDFVNFSEHPDPFPHGVAGTPFNTGCVYWHAGKFHAFYAGQDADGFSILRSESEDGVKFSYPGEVCFRRPKDLYRQDGTWRDPFVLYDEEAKLFRMVFCAKEPENGTPDCFAGRIGQAISTDLKNWQCLPPMDLGGIAMTTECPEIYRDDDRWVMIYYWHETRLRSAASFEGPWQRGSIISPDHFDFMAGRHMFDGKRHLLIGWLPRRSCDCGERIWGGNMLFPRELRMDGLTPKTRFAREIEDIFPKRSTSFSPSAFTFCNDGWTATETGFTAVSPAGGIMCYAPDLPDTCLIRMKVTFSDRNGQMLILLGTHEEAEGGLATENGYQLIVDPSENMIRLRRHYIWDQRNDIAVIPYTLGPDQTVKLEILRNCGILEVSVDGEQSLVSRMLCDAHGGFAISVQDTVAQIDDFSVHTRPCCCE